MKTRLGVKSEGHNNVKIVKDNGKKKVLKEINPYYEFSDGSRISLPAQRLAMREKVVAEIAKIGKMWVPQIQIINKNGILYVLEDFIPGKSLEEDINKETDLSPLFQRLNPESVIKSSILHFITKNTDPNLGNYIVTPDKILVPIDNEYTFGGNELPIRKRPDRIVKYYFNNLNPFPIEYIEDFTSKIPEIIDIAKQLSPFYSSHKFNHIIRNLYKRLSLLQDLTKKSGLTFIDVARVLKKK